MTQKETDEVTAKYTEEISSSKLVAAPVVSVCFITYNHANFVEQALDSILTQETDYSFEIVIGDDASDDGTSEIVDRYQREHPDKIKILRSSKNLGKVTGKSFQPNWIRNLCACRGKYIALIEGDDYWVNPNKIQKQVDYLELHPETSGCFTDCIIVNDSGEEIDPRPFWNDSYERSYDQKACLTSLRSSYGTATLLFRSSVLRGGLPEYFMNAGCDYLLDILIAEHGTLDYIPGTVSAYRIHQGGIWQGEIGSRNAKSFFERYLVLAQDSSMAYCYSNEIKRLCEERCRIYVASLAKEGFSPLDILERLGEISNYFRESKYLALNSIHTDAARKVAGDAWMQCVTEEKSYVNRIFRFLRTSSNRFEWRRIPLLSNVAASILRKRICRAK